MKDLYNNIKVVPVVSPISRANGNSDTVEVDLAGFNSAVIVWEMGAASGLSDSDKWHITMTHADDNGSGSAGSYANVAAKDILGATPASGVVLTADDDTEWANSIHTIGYVGGKRFIKLVLAETGTGPTIVQGICVIKGNPLDAPTN